MVPSKAWPTDRRNLASYLLKNLDVTIFLNTRSDIRICIHHASPCSNARCRCQGIRAGSAPSLLEAEHSFCFLMNVTTTYNCIRTFRQLEPQSKLQYLMQGLPKAYPWDSWRFARRAQTRSNPSVTGANKAIAVANLSKELCCLRTLYRDSNASLSVLTERGLVGPTLSSFSPNHSSFLFDCLRSWNAQCD